MLPKTLAWQALHLLTKIARGLAGWAGRTRHVDTLIYKVDRLGDWLLAEPTLARIITATVARGGSVVIWAGRESEGLRRWRPVGCQVETLVFEPRGWLARARRTLSFIRLLAIYRADTFYCLRHGPDPVRDFVLRAVDAPDIRALSWRMFPGECGRVPHEVQRHGWILAGAGLAPTDLAELLPRLEPAATEVGDRVVVAPFSSAAVKDWSDDAWQAVIAGVGHFAPRWELWVGPDQIARAGRLAELLSQANAHPVEVTVRSGSLSELAAAIGSARVILSVDTLAAHLAAALDAPLVALLGGGHYGDFAPWARSANQRWLSHPLPCFQCGWHCTRPRNDCLQLIRPARVIAEMSMLWETAATRRTATTACLPRANRTSP